MKYLGQNVSCGIQTRHDGRLMHDIHTHARVDDFDIVVRSQWVGRGQKISIELSSKQAISMVGIFVRDLD